MLVCGYNIHQVIFRKAKAYLELSLTKDNKKGFYKCVSSKRKIMENVRPLINQMSILVTENTEKTELLNALFVPVFTAADGSQES